MATASQPVFEVRIQGAGQPDHFCACLPDEKGQPLAESPFTWEAGRTELALLRSDLLKASEAAYPPAQPLHVDMGRRLYAALFGPPGQPSALGEEWTKRRKAAGRGGLTLLLRIDPATAWPLINLPWEYMFDEEDFLALNRCTPIVRIPWDQELSTSMYIEECLRLLVINAPMGSTPTNILNWAYEEDTIIKATLSAQAKGELEVVFASISNLSDLEMHITEWDPHILHYIGHGNYEEKQKRVVLQINENFEGSEIITDRDFVKAINRNAKSLRTIFLVSCESGVAAERAIFTSISDALIRCGFPASVAMQGKVIESSAVAFIKAMYEGIVLGKPISEVSALARAAMQKESPNGIDFAIPILTLTDPLCLRRSPSATNRTHLLPSSLGEVFEPIHFVGRASTLHKLQGHLDPQTGDRRVVVLHGMAGMGKTALAAKLAHRMFPHIDGVKAINFTSGITVKHVSEVLFHFINTHKYFFNLPENFISQSVMDDHNSLEDKVGVLAEVLNRRRILIILDGYEKIVNDWHKITNNNFSEDDIRSNNNLHQFLRLLIKHTYGGSRFLFTSRIDFDPLYPDASLDSVQHVTLSDLSFYEAAYLMNNIPIFRNLPLKNDPEGGITKMDIYSMVGGHPYSILYLAQQSQNEGIQQIIANMSMIHSKIITNTLIENIFVNLPSRTRELLQNGSVFTRPIPAEGMAYIMGNVQDAMPQIIKELKELTSLGFLTLSDQDERSYQIPEVTRSWIWNGLDTKLQSQLKKRAEEYLSKIVSEKHLFDSESTINPFFDSVSKSDNLFT